MLRSKKFIIIALLTIVVLAGSIGGVVFANTGNGEESGPGARDGVFLEKVCESYNTANPEAPIDCEALKAAFADARSQMRPEGLPDRPQMDPEAMREAMQERLQALLDEGKITQEQFEKMQERRDSMPDNLPRFGFRGHSFPRFFGPPCEPAEE